MGVAPYYGSLALRLGEGGGGSRGPHCSKGFPWGMWGGVWGSIPTGAPGFAAAVADVTYPLSPAPAPEERRDPLADAQAAAAKERTEPWKSLWARFVWGRVWCGGGYFLLKLRRFQKSLFPPLGVVPEIRTNETRTQRENSV